MKKTSKLLVLTASALFSVSALAGTWGRTSTTTTTTTATAPKFANIITAAKTKKDLSTFVMLAKKAGLTKTLEAKGPFTVFAPTNRAFSKLPKATLAALLKPENKAKLKSILLYHVVKGKLPSTMVKTGELTTVNGDGIQVMVSRGRVTLDKVAQVTKTDITTKNGVLHVINRVILPTS